VQKQFKSVVFGPVVGMVLAVKTFWTERDAAEFCQDCGKVYYKQIDGSWRPI